MPALNFPGPTFFVHVGSGQHWGEWECGVLVNTGGNGNVGFWSTLGGMGMWGSGQHWGEWECGVLINTGGNGNVGFWSTRLPYILCILCAIFKVSSQSLKYVSLFIVQGNK